MVADLFLFGDKDENAVMSNWGRFFCNSFLLAKMSYRKNVPRNVPVYSLLFIHHPCARLHSKMFLQRRKTLIADIMLHLAGIGHSDLGIHPKALEHI